MFTTEHRNQRGRLGPRAHGGEQRRSHVASPPLRGRGPHPRSGLLRPTPATSPGSVRHVHAALRRPDHLPDPGPDAEGSFQWHYLPLHAQRESPPATGWPGHRSACPVPGSLHVGRACAGHGPAQLRLWWRVISCLLGAVFPSDRRPVASAVTLPPGSRPPWAPLLCLPRPRISGAQPKCLFGRRSPSWPTQSPGSTRGPRSSTPSRWPLGASSPSPATTLSSEYEGQRVRGQQGCHSTRCSGAQGLGLRIGPAVSVK